jgi:hypothetical protein
MPIFPDPETFWGASLPQEADCRDAVIPRLPAALVRRFGNFRLWRGEARLADELRRLYEQASPAGLKVYMGDPPRR